MGAQAADPRASTTADQRPFGMLLLRAAEPSSRALRLLVGCFTEQRGHVKTGEYASIRLSGRLDTLQSAAQPVSQSAVGFFDSGGLFVSMTTISSQRN